MLLEMRVYDSFFGTMFKSLRFHLSTLDTARFQNDAFSKGLTFEIVFISVFDPFSVDDRRQKCIKTYAFSYENVLVRSCPLKRGPKIVTLKFVLNLAYVTPNFHSSSFMN